MLLLEVNLNVFQIFALGAILNGLILSILLPVKKVNKNANRFLALLLLATSFSLFSPIMLDLQLYDKFPWLHWLPFSLSFWIGPSFYFYIKKLTEPAFNFNAKHLWHFSLVIFNYLHSIYHLILGRADPYPLLHNFTEAVESYALVSILIYLFFSLKMISKYQQSILQQVSNIDRVHLSWLKQLVVVMMALIAFGMVALVVGFEILVDFSREYSESSLFPIRDMALAVYSALLYWLGFGGFSQMQTVSSPASFDGSANEEVEYAGAIKLLNEAMLAKKIFLDPALSLNGLSHQIGLSERDISNALNKGLNKNFYTFVNEYRVGEVKKKLEDPAYSHLKILSIAYDAGFNSKATFNRIFKEQTGMSPNEYRAK